MTIIITLCGSRFKYHAYGAREAYAFSCGVHVMKMGRVPLNDGAFFPSPAPVTPHDD